MVLGTHFRCGRASAWRSVTASTVRSRMTLPVAVMAAAGVVSGPAFAQDDANGWVLDLPRPGYEPRQISAGPATIDASLTVETVFNSNIFATPTDEEEDVIFLVSPFVSAEAPWRNTVFNAVAYANLRRFAENTQENVNTFGVSTSVGAKMGGSQTASVEARYDRTFERRDDPDANTTSADPLTTIDNVGAEFQHTYRPGRFGVSSAFGVTKSDYRSIVDDDRDMTTYQISSRGLIGVSSQIDAFVQGFATFRDARLAVDRTGVNRDSATFGALTGVALDVTEKLDGEIGVGVFRADLDDPTLDDFTGVSVLGNLRWSPRPRTGVILNVFRGDVATIRSGASGRVDFRAGVEVIQEVRHNIRGRASVRYRNGRFRTTNPETEKDVIVRAGGEYLLNRNVALTADYELRNRDSTRIGDDFTAHSFGVALELSY